MLLKAAPLAKVTGATGRRTSFEVTVNGKLIFSKLTKGGFPNFSEVVKSVDGVAHGQEPTDCVEVKKECIIL